MSGPIQFIDYHLDQWLLNMERIVMFISRSSISRCDDDGLRIERRIGNFPFRTNNLGEIVPIKGRKAPCTDAMNTRGKNERATDDVFSRIPIGLICSKAFHRLNGSKEVI